MYKRQPPLHPLPVDLLQSPVKQPDHQQVPLPDHLLAVHLQDHLLAVHLQDHLLAVHLMDQPDLPRAHLLYHRLRVQVKIQVAVTTQAVPQLQNPQ